jgi:phosphoribosylformylglycinamidine (FGAM) synthase-like enzyme
VYLNPRKGGQIAVVEAARNVVCSGAKPVAITNCLNFGNPYKPEVYWVFKEAVGGMGDACKLLNTPVTGGNVSFYNENPKAAVFPTPTIGMLGYIDDLEKHTTTLTFKDDGDVIAYIGAPRKGLDGSEYVSWIHKKTVGDAPELDMDFESNLQKSLLEAIKSGNIKAAHDISDGGLSIALAEMAIHSGKGAVIDLNGLDGSDTEKLFSEAQSGIVVSCSKDQWPTLKAQMNKTGVPIVKLGEVGGSSLNVNNLFDIDVNEMKDIYESVIPKAMNK